MRPAHAILLSFALIASGFPAFAAPAADAALQQVVDGSWRSAANKARDQYRHPVATLQFFGIRPDMTVVELAPGGGWYTEILAPYLRVKGQLIEAAPPLDSKSAFARRMARHFHDKIKAAPDLYSKISLAPFSPPGQTRLGPDDSADMVVTFRNLHDWENAGSLDSVFKAAWRVLKPGGVFGVVEHRARPYADPVKSARDLHRLPETYVIALALKTGFQLDGVSQINANPKDTETLNVHRLLPSLDHGDNSAQKERYRKIGESDRMTLRFVKPSRD